jgi:hypothetical protein
MVCCFLIFFFSSTFPRYWQGNFKSIGQFYDHSDNFMTNASTVALIVNLAGRLFTGSASDLKGFKKVGFAVCVMAILLSVGF